MPHGYVEAAGRIHLNDYDLGVVIRGAGDGAGREAGDDGIDGALNGDEINGPLSGRAKRQRKHHCQRYPKRESSPPHHGTPVSNIRNSRGLAPLLLIAEGNRLPVKGNVTHLETRRDGRVVPVNPMRSITPPPASPARVEWRDVPELTRIADGQPEPYRTLSALLAGTGIEVSVAVQLKRRDVDSARREIRAAGTKTHARDRIARVAQWAWPYVERHIAALHPDTPLFPPGVDRWAARETRVDACKALGIANYRQQDHRHSWAVRALRAGTPVELVSRQLGHANAVLVLKVYGRFRPTHEDRDKWERNAAMQDEQAAAVATRGSVHGSIQIRSKTGKAANRMPISGLRSSRGGTRTRDPGIMSAVL